MFTLIDARSLQARLASAHHGWLVAPILSGGAMVSRMWSVAVDVDMVAAGGWRRFGCALVCRLGDSLIE
jgi:hypothetical protein